MVEFPWKYPTRIECLVPPSTNAISNQVRVTVYDGLNSTISSAQLTYNSTISSAQLTYNSTILPAINSINPKYLTMVEGFVEINGTGFGNGDLSVLVDTENVRVVSSSNTRIVVSLGSLSAGRHPIRVRTSTGFAKPLFHIEYRFSIQEIFPRIGSAYGGNDLFINGFGFENGTRVQLRSTKDNRTSSCQILSIQSNQIHCKTTLNSPQIRIASHGTHPNFGFGHSCFPSTETIQQGTTVNWYWDFDQLSSPAFYRIQQVDNAYATSPTSNGFDSGTPTSSGSYSYLFDTVETFYYWSPNIQPGYSMRGSIDVIPLDDQLNNVEVIWEKFTAQKCSFPFVFNSVNYSSCTMINDTQLWCSPTSVYSGQRLSCTPTASISNSSCSSRTLNISSCSSSVVTPSNPDEYLSTTCSIETVTDLSPREGPVGTQLILTGLNFVGNACEYEIEIGSSYRCPVLTKTSTQLRCQLSSGSMLDPTKENQVRVYRKNQGYLACRNQLKFQYLPSISNISPMVGSIKGGTRVTIDGDGFLSNSTFVYIVGANFTAQGSLSYSRIVFTTLRELIYQNLPLNLHVYVGTNEAECFLSSCDYTWSTSVTPIILSVSPTNIRGLTNLTILEENFLLGGRTNANATIRIDENVCNVTQITNQSIRCTINGVKAGKYPIVGSIDEIGNVDSNVNITSDAFVSTIEPLTTGIRGGAILNIDGHGFSDNQTDIQVTIGSNPCRVIEAMEDQIPCEIPPRTNNLNTVNINITSHQILFPSSSFSLNYSEIITSNVTSVSPNSGNGLQALTIQGNPFIGPGQTDVFSR